MSPVRGTYARQATSCGFPMWIWILLVKRVDRLVVGQEYRQTVSAGMQRKLSPPRMAPKISSPYTGFGVGHLLRGLGGFMDRVTFGIRVNARDIDQPPIIT